MQCSHCGREVSETRHIQKGYRVDYYVLHTGHTERVFIKNPKDDLAPLHYLKLSRPVDILSCAQCYERPEIRKRLDDDFDGLRSILDTEPVKNRGENQLENCHG